MKLPPDFVQNDSSINKTLWRIIIYTLIDGNWVPYEKTNIYQSESAMHGQLSATQNRIDNRWMLVGRHIELGQKLDLSEANPKWTTIRTVGADHYDQNS